MKNFTMQELMTALDANFDGYEKLRSGLVYHTPKYGNADEKGNAALFDFLKEYCSGEPFDSDAVELKKRLELREGDKCIVGFVSEKELRRLMQKNRSTV